MGGVSDIAKKLGGVLAVTFGAREIVRFASSAIESASDYTESVNAVEVATGRAAREIFQLGETAAESMGLSRTAVNEAAVAFSAFGEQISEDDNIANEFEDFTQRAVDFASVMNIDMKKAFETFQSTLAGQSKPIRAFGLDTSAAAVKVFALANGIGAVGRELTESEKIQARYGLLMEETEKFAGDFANTSGELANQQRTLAARFENTKIALGDALLPVMTDFVVVLNGVSDSGDGLIKKLDELITTGRKSGKVLAIAADDSLSYLQRLDAIRESASDFVQTNLSFIPMVGDDLAGAWKRAETAVGLAGDKFDETNDQMSDLADTTVTYVDTITPLADDLSDAAAAQDDFNDALTRFEVPGVWDAFVNSVRNIGLNLASAQKGIGGGGGKVDFLAHGGTIQPGGSAVVGENGPEFISPRGGATITPMNGARGGGGGAVTINFNGVVGDPVAVAQEIQDLLDLNGRVNGPASGI